MRPDQITAIQVRELSGVVHDRTHAKRRCDARRGLDETLMHGIPIQQARADTWGARHCPAIESEPVRCRDSAGRRQPRTDELSSAGDPANVRKRTPPDKSDILFL